MYTNQICISYFFSYFGKAFEQVSNKTNIEVSFDYFNSSIVKMKVQDRTKFFDAMTALLS